MVNLLRLALAACFLVISPTAFAQSGYSFGCPTIVLQSVKGQRDFTKMIEDAQLSERSLNAQVTELEAELEFLDSFKGDYLIKTGESWVGLSERDVYQISAQLGLFILLSDFDKTIDQANKGEDPTLPLLPGNTELHDVLNAGILSAGTREYWKQRSANSEEVSVESLSTFVFRQVKTSLQANNDKNRAEISSRRREIHAQLAGIEEQRTALARLVEQAIVCRDALKKTESAGLEAGLYAFQRSGEGWRKMYGGRAYRITGHDIFYLKAVEGVSKPRWTGTLWEVPVGLNISDFFAERKAAKKAESDQACASGPATCPCATRPDIWETGPTYSLYPDRFDTSAELIEAVGSRTVPNNDPGGTSFWEYDQNRSYAEAEAACEK